MYAAFTVTPSSFFSTPLLRRRIVPAAVSHRTLLVASMATLSIPALVQPAWLEKNLERVTVLDATYLMPSEKRDADAEFIEKRIAGARRFNIDAPGIADANAPLAHTVPAARDFGAAVRALGVRASRPVVVYARNINYFGATRAWWMFRLFGKLDVGVLDGGFNRWKGPTQSGKVPPLVDDGADVLEPRLNPELLRDMDAMVKHSKESDVLIIDVRGAGRFRGETPEPRPGMRAGHIPGSINMPYRETLKEDGTFLSRDELRKYFERKGVPLGDKKRTIVTTCGSGVSACNTALALYIADGQDAAVYDGSWSEYGRVDNNPIETAD